MVNTVEDKHILPIVIYLYDFSVQSSRKENNLVKQDFSDIICEERKREIEQTADINEKKRKYYSWKLLQFALAKCGEDLKKQSFFRNKNGKWFANGIYFSISHTQTIVAVAVADCEVGIDIEKSDRTIDKALFDKIACEAEKNAYYLPNVNDILTLWTQKEAIFKRNGGEIFLAREINTITENVKTTVTDDKELIISVSSVSPFSLNVFRITDLP